MSRVLVDEYLWLMDQAFARPRGPMGDAQSVLGNLATVEDDWWNVLPPGCKRSIRHIAGHVGGAKFIYDDNTFRGGTMSWATLPPLPGDGAWTPPRMIDWLKEGHRRLVESVSALDDEGLQAPGTTMSKREVLRLMIEHDLYHAGEINHLRSLISGRDGWAWEQDTR